MKQCKHCTEERLCVLFEECCDGYMTHCPDYEPKGDEKNDRAKQDL